MQNNICLFHFCDLFRMDESASVSFQIVRALEMRILKLYSMTLKAILEI
jgi:hypothetical protein